MQKFASPDHQNQLKDHCTRYAYCEKDPKFGLTVYKEADCPSGQFFDPDSAKCGALIRKPTGCDGYETCQKLPHGGFRRTQMTCGMLSSLKNMVYVGPGGEFLIFVQSNMFTFNIQYTVYLEPSRPILFAKLYLKCFISVPKFKL